MWRKLTSSRDESAAPIVLSADEEGKFAKVEDREFKVESKAQTAAAGKATAAQGLVLPSYTLGTEAHVLVGSLNPTTGDPPRNLRWRLGRAGTRHIAGLDEAGRGPLAGPVVAAAVLPRRCRLPGLNDSKQIGIGPCSAIRSKLFDGHR